MKSSTAQGSTYVCLLTPAGRGAVAVISIRGSQAASAVNHFFKAKNKKAAFEQELNRIVYGVWGSDDSEDLVICRIAEDAFEIHCHGGEQSSAKIITDLTDRGCRQIDWSTWLASQDACPIEAQAQHALSESTTLRTAEILLDQYHGALGGAIRKVIDSLRNAKFEQAAAGLTELLDQAKLGLHLAQAWKVMIAGRPNVGKSSLINSLAGFKRAIVFDQPGTTRDIVTTSTAVEGWPIEFSDTAGLHQTEETIESAGIELAKEQLKNAELVLWVIDANSLGNHSPWEISVKQAKEVHLDLSRDSTLLVINKIDLLDAPAHIDADCIPTSAMTGEGIEGLLANIANRLVPNPPEPGTAVPFTHEQVVGIQSAYSACQQTDFDTATHILEGLLAGDPSIQC